MNEIKKTKFKNLNIITLGSRQNLCVNPDVNKLGSISKINESCKSKLEKVDNKKCNFFENLQENSLFFEYLFYDKI